MIVSKISTQQYSADLKKKIKMTISLSLAPTTQKSKLIQNLCYHVSEGQEYLSEISKQSKLNWEEWMWDVFSILSSGGAVIQEIQCMRQAVYSPTIHELIQEGKLLNFR